MKFDWKYLVMLAATLGSVLVPVWLWQTEATSQLLTARILSSTSLQPEVAQLKNNVQILIAGVTIDSPYLLISQKYRLQRDA